MQHLKLLYSYLYIHRINLISIKIQEIIEIKILYIPIRNNNYIWSFQEKKQKFQLYSFASAVFVRNLILHFEELRTEKRRIKVVHIIFFCFFLLLDIIIISNWSISDPDLWTDTIEIGLVIWKLKIIFISGSLYKKGHVFNVIIKNKITKELYIIYKAFTAIRLYFYLMHYIVILTYIFL